MTYFRELVGGWFNTRTYILKPFLLQEVRAHCFVSVHSAANVLCVTFRSLSAPLPLSLALLVRPSHSVPSL